MHVYDRPLIIEVSYATDKSLNFHDLQDSQKVS